MSELWNRAESLARLWLQSLATVMPQMTDQQKLFLGAITTGPPILRNSSLPIDWTLYDRFIELLRECPRFDKVASYGVSGSTVRAEDVPFRLASVCLDRERQSLDSQLIEAALRDLRSYMEEDEVRVSARCELFGYWADAAVQIAENLAIVPNTSEPSLVTLMMLIPQGRYCLEAHGTVGLSFDTQLFTDLRPTPHQDAATVSSLYNDVALATQVLMILQPGTFTPGPIDLVYHNWLLTSGFQSRPARQVYPTSFDRYDFDSAGVETLRALFAIAKGLQGAGPRHVLVALGRFYLAQFRSNLDDKLIDLIIAAEALFLNDVSGELSYRLATRAAIFLADDRKDRIETFNKVRTAYTSRNSIVHGSRVGASIISQTAKDMGEIMRESIKKALSTVGAGRPDAVTSWDDLAFLDI